MLLSSEENACNLGVNNGVMHTGTSSGGLSEDYRWSLEELKDLGHVTVLLAADAIYDDTLTDALFDCLERLMAVGSAKVCRRNPECFLVLFERSRLSHVIASALWIRSGNALSSFD